MSATTAALRDSQLAGALQGAGLDVIADSSAELAQHLKRETQRYGEAIRVSGETGLIPTGRWYARQTSEVAVRTP